MKAFLIIPAMALLGGWAVQAAVQSSPSDREAARTASLLAGRTAGEPVSCVNLRDLRGNSSTGDGGILFESNNGTVYVNRPPGGCPDLRSYRTLVTRTLGTRLCSGDIARVVDPTNGIEYGACGLGEFVPYPRPPRN